MINCPKCNTLFDPGKWKRKFCSSHCSHSRVFSEEAKLKKSLALRGRKISSIISYDIEAWRNKIRETRRIKQDAKPFEELGFGSKRKRIIKEQQGCCARCGIHEWQSFPIVLEIDHKDGNNQNNTRENMEGLCPNCHSITDTWRGRNKPVTNGKKKVTDDVLLKCLLESTSIREGLLKAGLSAKGANYSRAKTLLTTVDRR